MDPLLAVLAQPLVAGKIVRIAANGLLAVKRSDDDHEIWCDRLDAGPAYTEGDEVILCNVAGRERTVVLGRIAAAQRSGPTPESPIPAAHPTPDTLVIEARESLRLRCGDGSITIRADGRIVITGTDLVSHAKRLNRIRGGSVAIN